MANRKIRAYLALITSLLGTACTTSASRHYDLKAESLGAIKSTIATKEFDLIVYQNTNPKGEWLHIYLEGDGSPFFRRTHISPDPTSRKAVALKMMAADPHKSYLIGRPCYHQGGKTRGCAETKWWTSHRYSLDVVQSIEDALTHLAPRDTQIILIGFSGGGSLATILANRNPGRIKRLVTISANLDINAWSQHNRFTPLFGSQNPIEHLPNTVESFHLVGDKDQQLGFKYWQQELGSAVNTHFRSYADFDHGCCWADFWGTILVDVLAD